MMNTPKLVQRQSVEDPSALGTDNYYELDHSGNCSSNVELLVNDDL